MSKGLEQTLLQGEHTEGLKTYERMLSITSHQRDVNLNHNEIPLHTSQNGHYNQINKQQVLVHCWWECKLVHPLWKTLWNFLRKLKMELSFHLEIPPLGSYPKNPETPIQKSLCTPMCIAAQFTIAKY